jgi:glycosyltransferase involved in cell wall biosynthesis
MPGVRIEVIIPVYQGGAYLAQAIESVLAQSYPAVRIIVVDDGSTDATAQVAARFGPPIHYQYQAQRGASAARNRGVELVQGEYIAFLDADDLWTADKLEWQVSALRNDPVPDMVFGQVQQFHSPDLPAEMKARIACPAQPMPGYIPDTLLMRCETFKRVGPFDERWRTGEFLDWYLRAIDMGLRSVMLPQIVTQRRLHRANHGITGRETRSDYHRILKASLDRHRNLRS